MAVSSEFPSRRFVGEMLAPLGGAAFLLVLAQADFLLFHTVAELFSIVVGVTLFLVVRSTHRFTRNDYLYYLGCAYFWVAVIDLFHTFSYEGLALMGPLGGTNAATQFWITARTLEVGALLSASLFLTGRHRLVPGVAFGTFGALSTLCGALIATGHFPTGYTEGEGLTTFKVAGEYLLIALLGVAFLLLWRQRNHLDRRIYRMMTAAIAVTAVAEAAFTSYVSIYDFANVLGHVLKFLSFWLILVAGVRTTLEEPFAVLTRELNTFDAVPDPTLAVGRDGVIRQVNRACEHEFHRHRTALVGTPFKAVWDSVHDAEAGRRLLQHIAAGDSTDGIELRDRAQERWLLASITPVKAQAGGAVSLLVLRDITTLKEAEAALRRQSAELERSNAELEQFAYVASHDLQEPLRMIASYLGLIERRYGATFDQDGRDFLHYAADGAKRMSAMIRDLLEYSRIGAQGSPFRPVAMKEVVEVALRDLSVTIETAGAKVHVPPTLPTVWGDETWITRVLSNLIGNAIKYRHPDRTPEVLPGGAPGPNALAFPGRRQRYRHRTGP